jgi:DNA-binding transcriptional LysR family regulator
MHKLHGRYPWRVTEFLSLRADLDLRLVRYFVAVAEHQNFGRAAEALHVAQPSLSRQIQRLEQQVGVRLLDRTPQGSRLTEAGQVFLPQAQGLLRSAHQAAGLARAAGAAGAVTIGYVGDFVITPAIRDLRRQHPDAEIRTRHLDWHDAPSALPNHQVDALVARQPFPFATDGLQITVLYDEPRVLIVPTTHRLAGKQSVSLEDFADEPLVRYPGTDTAWSAFWRLEPRPDGRPAPTGPVVETFEDKLECVANGQAVAILPAGDQRSTLRRDLTNIPIVGVEPCQVVLATRKHERSQLVEAFRRSASERLPGGPSRRVARSAAAA